MKPPSEILQRVQARKDAPANVGKIVWCEHTNNGDWLVHATTRAIFERRVQAAFNLGHSVWAPPTGV